MKRNDQAKANGPPPLRSKNVPVTYSIKNAIDLLTSYGYRVTAPTNAGADGMPAVNTQPIACGRGRSYSISEVAIAWNVCYRTVYRAVCRGDLTAIKIGNVYRIPEEAMLMYERYGPCKK